METLIFFIISEIVDFISTHFLKIKKHLVSMIFLVVVGYTAVVLHKDDIVYQVLFLMFRNYIIMATAYKG